MSHPIDIQTFASTDSYDKLDNLHAEFQYQNVQLKYMEKRIEVIGYASFFIIGFLIASFILFGLYKLNKAINRYIKKEMSLPLHLRNVNNYRQNIAPPKYVSESNRK
uniref:Uncharacterized protein n=1 Tax=Parastrongyloides trichosuri TaxID=131310 RepID=A0A0N5A0A7_PARTI